MSEAAHKISLGYTPRPWQQKFHALKKRFNVIVSHRRSGKSYGWIAEMFHCAIMSQERSPRYAFISPELKQSKRNVWGYCKDFARKIPGCEMRESELIIRLPHNNAEIALWGANDPDALRGAYLDGVVMDEFAQMSPEVWEEIVYPTLLNKGRAPGWATILGTPNGVNLFSELYYKKQNDPEWLTLLFTVMDTCVFTQDEVEGFRRNMPSHKFEKEYMCSFEISAENALLSFATISDARARDVEASGPVVIGVDVARSGKDASVICVRQGRKILELAKFRIDNSQLVAQQVMRRVERFKPRAVNIDGSGGYGSGVVDRCRQFGCPVHDVQFGGRADDEDRYANKRAEMWFRMAEWVELEGQLPNDPDLAKELQAVTYKHDVRDRLLLETKDMIRQRLGWSPDSGDALALSFFSILYDHQKHSPDYKLDPFGFPVIVKPARSSDLWFEADGPEHFAIR